MSRTTCSIALIAVGQVQNTPLLARGAPLRSNRLMVMGIVAPQQLSAEIIRRISPD